MPSAASGDSVLVTGAAGFIGMHVCRALLDRGNRVTGLDNLNGYYDPQLKRDRLKQLEGPGFSFEEADIVDGNRLRQIVAQSGAKRIVHLAAQAGVRYSIENPMAYVQSNVVGFANMLEACRGEGVEHLVYASSSSVYGDNNKLPFSEIDPTDQPASTYAATKKANELMAHSYSDLYGLRSTGLRYFTVYGPWGRPDMAYYSFARAIMSGTPIKVFNEGRMKRDFTYVDDAVQATVRVLDLQLSAGNGVYNVGNRHPVALPDFIATLERLLGREAVKQMAPMQAGDMVETYADTAALDAAVGFCPGTPLEQGLSAFVAWFRKYHKL